MLKRYIIEFGSGIDFHGQDYTGAACKAVKDAVSHGCLCGLTELLGLQDLNDMVVDITIAVPSPDSVDKDKVLAEVPFGQKQIKVIAGGMQVPGMYLPALGDKDDSIVVANACLEVKVPCN